MKLASPVHSEKGSNEVVEVCLENPASRIEGWLPL